MTAIQWTDETWNPLRARRKDGTNKEGWACVRVSPGCVNCYAATQNRAGWAGGTGLDYTVPALKLVDTYLHELTLRKPLHWRTPRKVFVCSMTDLFGEWVTDDQLNRIFDLMEATPRHTYQVLTKRPDRMRSYLSWRWGNEDGQNRIPSRHIWLGTSVEDQKAADERIPHLLATPAAVRFLSCEPLLGPVDLTRWMDTEEQTYQINESRTNNLLGVMREIDTETTDRLVELGRGIRTELAPKRDWPIQWVIVGGESGPRARPMDLAWARSLVAQCRRGGRRAVREAARRSLGAARRCGQGLGRPSRGRTRLLARRPPRPRLPRGVRTRCSVRRDVHAQHLFALCAKQTPNVPRPRKHL